MLTQEELKKYVHYNPETGLFTRKFRERDYFKSDQQFHVWNKRFANKIVATTSIRGYIEFCLDYKFYKAHRLAFLYMNGKMPKGTVDHINHIKNDNRWINLRDVSQRTNSANQKMNCKNKSGVTGVNWYPKYNKWIARIGNNMNRVFLGYFDDLNDAKEAVMKARKKYEYHENHGTK